MDGWSTQLHESVPALAWLAICEGPRVTVHHGRAVETFEKGVFEGAWAGDFADGQFAAARGVFGSGVSFDEDGVLFVAPCHTLEALYFQSAGERFFVSNSLPFLLSGSQSTPKWERRTSRRFATAVLGVEAYDAFLFDTDKGAVRRVIHDNLRWCSSRAPERVAKPPYADCSTFHEYRDLLTEELRSLFANAADDRRRSPYTPLATCSSGYDSTAALALARPLGCERAVTLATARQGVSDSGEDVAAALGVGLTCHPRVDEADIAHVHEFFATGMGAGDIVYSCFEPDLAGALLLTGFHGDKVWAKDVKPNGVLERGDTSGSTLGEFRLRTNFVHVPVPFIAGRQHPSTARIGKSPEMAPYSVGGSYDRPIARRIAEEAGVPRDAFGTKKKAVSILVRDRERQPPEFRNEVDAFMASLPAAARFGTPIMSRLFSPRRRIIIKLERRAAASRSKMMRSLLHATRDLLGGDRRVFARCGPTASAEFCVAVTQLKSRYSLEPPL